MQMDTKDNTIIIPTEGRADEIIDAPTFRELVEGVRADTISPLVDLRPFLPGQPKT